MYLYFTLGFALITILVDLYFFRFLKKQFKPSLQVNSFKWLKISYWSFTLLSVIFYIIAASYYFAQVPPPVIARTYIYGVLFIILLSKLTGIAFYLLDDVKSMMAYLFRKSNNKSLSTVGDKMSRASFIRKTGTVASLLPFTGLMYGVVKSAYDFRVIRQKVVSNKLPDALHGLSIVQISDIHTGSFLNTSFVSPAVKLINDLQLDLILFTGDLVNERSEEAIPFINEFKHLEASQGVYSVLGNHDYGDYYYQPGDEDGRKHNRMVMKQVQEEMGWDLLLNTNKTLSVKGAQLGLTGVENWGRHARFQKYGDLDLALKEADTALFNILLSHDPSHWDIIVKNHSFPVDLTLSGHTHGFQMGVEIPGYVKWSPSQYMYPQWAGLYHQHEKQLYVNKGLGFLGYPGRLGMLPEITYIELQKELT